MKTQFQLYKGETSKLKSSLFDLISGDLETKQTKGFAFLLYYYPELLKSIIHKTDIGIRLKKSLSLKDVETAIINAEMVSTERKRADIVIRFYKDNKPNVALVIEAKSIKIKVNEESLFNQTADYIANSFPGLNLFDTHGILLSKNKIVSDKFICITWQKIIDVIESLIS